MLGTNLDLCDGTVPHLVIFQIDHLLCESSLRVIYLLQPLERSREDKEVKVVQLL